MKGTFVFLMIFSVLFSYFVNPAPVYAKPFEQQTLGDLQNELASLKRKKAENEAQKEETKKQTITPVEGKFIVSDKIIQMKEDVNQIINDTLTNGQIEKSFDKHTMYILSSILDGKLEIQ